MNYFSQFRNINEKLYQVDFDINNGVVGSAELVLSSEPFSVEYNGGDTIFEPLKLSNASCSIITTDLLTDFFSSKVHDVKVTLTNLTENKIEWVGYTTPCVYSQGWEKENEVLELELIDGLSTLNNFFYQQINENKTTYVSFIDLIINSMKKCNCYNKIYVNNNLFITGVNNYNNVNENLYVHEMNFVGDDKNETMKDVLYNLMEFINCSMVAVGDSVYILDYNHIDSLQPEYTLYSSDDNWSTYDIQIVSDLIDYHQLTANSFSKNGAKISLTDTKNKATIEVENKTVTDIIPEFFDDELLENITNESTGESNKYFKYQVYQGDTTHIIRWVRNSKFKDVNYYKPNGATGYTETFLNDYNSVKLSSAQYLGGTLRQIASYKNNEIPSKLTFTNYLALKRWYSSNDVNKPEMKMFQYVSDKDVALLYDDYYLLINCEINHDTVFDSYAPFENTTKETINEQQALANGMYLPIKIQIGNKFWNGTSWTTTDSTFRLNFDLQENKKLFYKWHKVKNQTYYYDELDGEGQKIPISKNDYLVGNPIITIYSPVYTTSTYSIFIGTIWLKDFEIKLLKKDNLLGLVKENTDTIYTNVINDDFVNEFDSKKLKLNTDVNKGLCYSSVLLKNDSGNFELLNEISSQTNSTKKQEYNIIENLVDLYEAPKKKLTLNLKNKFKPYSIIGISGEKYKIDTFSMDYKNDSSELTIINV